MTAITLGRVSPPRLGATYPPTPRNHVNVGLLGIAARRDCPFHPGRVPRHGWLWGFPACAGNRLACASRASLRWHPIDHPQLRNRSRLVSVALILTSRWAAVSCCAVLCSPDVPPVPGFPYGTSGGLACFTGRIIAQTQWRTPSPVRNGSIIWRANRRLFLPGAPAMNWCARPNS